MKIKETVAILLCAGLFVGALQWFAAIMYGGREGCFLLVFLTAWAIVHTLTLTKLQKALVREESQRRLKESAISENRKSNLGGE
ncbi:MAG: hypothetical protein IJ740_08405 [Ruminococcus sp.]|nr:hypothetical protein [Ruminococcus sp.]